MPAMYDTLVELLTDELGVPAEDIGPGSTLEQLEIDSLALVELSLRMKERIGVAPPEDTALTTASTLAEAADLFQKIADSAPAAN